MTADSASEMSSAGRDRPWSRSTCSAPTRGRRSCWTTARAAGSTTPTVNAYLDCVAGIAVNALGHGDPGLHGSADRAGEQAVARLEPLPHGAAGSAWPELLCENSFADRVFFCNSGAEANEAAFKFARKWAGTCLGADKHVIVAFTDAFHGRTFGALSATPKEKYQAPFRPLLPGVQIAPFNDLAGTAEADERRRLRGDRRAGAGRGRRLPGRSGVPERAARALQPLQRLADLRRSAVRPGSDRAPCGRTRVTGSRPTC